MFKAVIKYKYWIILALLFLFLRIPSLFEPYWYGDEGIYLVLGEAIRKGVTLYSHIHDNKPPTLYYLAAIAHTVFGFRLLLLCFMAPTIYFFHRLSQIFISRKATKFTTLFFLVLTSIPYLEGNIANAEIFMLLPTVLAFYLFCKKYFSIQKSSIPLNVLVYVGLLLGIAFTIKIPVAIEFAFLCLWLLIDETNSLKNFFSRILSCFIFGLSFLFPIILWTIYFYFKGAIKPFLSASLFQNFGYLSSWSTGTQTSSVSSGGITTRFLILLGVWFIIFILKNRNIFSKKFSFLLFWFSATIFGSLLSGRPYPHYLIQTLPPLILLIIEIFNFKNKKNQFFSLLSIFSFILIVYKFDFYFYPVYSYYSNFYSYTIGQKSLSNYRNYFGSEINDIYDISSYVDSNTNSNDKIFIWGDQAYIYALSNRLPATKYTVAYHIVDFNGYQLTMDEIKINLPRLIIYYQMSGRSFSDLDSFISKYYFIANTIGNATIFKLR